MNLTELQIQLRQIEEHLSTLQAEIEKMKPQPEIENKLRFDKITEIAKKYPLLNRKYPISINTDIRDYISCLAYVAIVDEYMLHDKLLYLCRLSNGIGFDASAEDLLKMGLEFDSKYLGIICSEIKEHKYSFLVDALILVNIAGETTEESLRVITDIAKIFEFDREDIRMAAMVAKAVLVDDFDVLKQIPVPSKNHWMGQFRQHIPENWIKEQRIKCNTLLTGRYYAGGVLSDPSMMFSTNLKTGVCNITKRVNAGTIVKKGDEIVSYELTVSAERTPMRFTSIAEKKENKSIYAPCDGVVFFIENSKTTSTTNQIEKYMDVYVVSYFDEYTAFCEWHKKR